MKISDILKEDKVTLTYEVFPPRAGDSYESVAEKARAIAELRPAFMSVTYGAGGGRSAYTVELASDISRRFGVESLAHLTCVSSTREQVARVLAELKAHGVENILALRGDIPKGQDIDWETAEFRHAADLVRFAKAHYPDMGIGVAGYPAPHPESPSFASDWRYTVAKIREGADFVITQLFFDVREYLHFVDRLSDMGVSVPVIPGILPIQSLESIRRTLSLCGANIPGKLYLALEEANAKGGAEAVREAGLKFAVQQIRTLLDNGAPGIHLYTLNKASMCLRIAEEVGAL